MKELKTIVVIGGVAGGAGAAVKARRTDESASIIVFEKGPYVSYANCGVPYYVGQDIRDRGELLLITPERFKERYNIDVHVGHEVTRIDPSRKVVEVEVKATGVTFEQAYDRLVIATGSQPVPPPVPGVKADNVFTLWTVPDADGIVAWAKGRKVSRAAVVGAGFVGLEAVEALVHLGAKVTLVEFAPQVMPSFDTEMVSQIPGYLKGKGVDVRLATRVERFEGGSTVSRIVLSDGTEVETDLVIVAAGVKPLVGLAAEAGLEIGKTGGVVVDATMRTSEPDIFAAGDIVESVDLVSGDKVRIPLAGPANKQARVAGSNAAGGHLTFKGVIGSSIVKVMEMTLARTGLTERDAKAKGIPHFCSYTHNGHHAGYYPGSSNMTIKLVVEEGTGRVLGAQIVGQEGVDKRIDVLATAIYGRMTVEDLEDLDLAYAPPYSSAKDPVNIAGMVAANVVRGEVSIATASKLREMLLAGEDIQIVDVRTPGEFAAGHVLGAANVPVDEMRARYTELDKGRKTVLYCGIAYRSYLAMRMLADKGSSELSHVSGGYKSIVAEGVPRE